MQMPVQAIGPCIQINSFVVMRWELNRNGKIVVFAKDAPIACTEFSAVKQVANFVVPVLGDNDAKVRRAMIHVVISVPSSINING